LPRRASPLSVPSRGRLRLGAGPMQAMERQSLTGIGPVGIGLSWAYAYWQYTYEEQEDGRHGDERWDVRMNLDDFDRLNVPPYQWVRLQLPARKPEVVYFKGHRD